MNTTVIRTVAAAAAVIALGFAAWGLGNSTSSDSTSSAGAPSSASTAPAGRQAPQPGQAPQGFGTVVTGTTADKVKKAALTKYPGTLEGVMALPDGSFVAHVIRPSGELHVAVSKDFKVLGIEQGGPPPGAAPPSNP
ncbi:MAG TPA: hypothetical protein VGJ70_01390, partial [Solirubrobacteraceae bacterium]